MAERKISTDRQQVAPVAEVFFLLIQLDDEQRQRGHQTRGRGNGKAQKILARARKIHGGKTIEPRQPERAAKQVNRGDEPAQFGVFARQRMAQHHPMHQKCRRNAKGHQVGQRIKLAAERAFVPAHARHPAVKQIKNAGQQNAGQGKLDGPPIDQSVTGSGVEVGLHNLGQRHETAEQIPRRQQVGQKINFQLRSLSLGGSDGLGCRGFVSIWPSHEFRQNGFAADHVVAKLDFDPGVLAADKHPRANRIESG